MNLLKKPLKHLKVRKAHAPELYVEAYDTEALVASPFVQGLMSTKMDVFRQKYPIGCMVQMVVANHELVPVLEKPQGQNPASYILNRRKYLNAVSAKLQPLPLKYRYHSPTSMGIVRCEQGLGERVATMYNDYIDEYEKLSGPVAAAGRTPVIGLEHQVPAKAAAVYVKRQMLR